MKNFGKLIIKSVNIDQLLQSKLQSMQKVYIAVETSNKNGKCEKRSMHKMQIIEEKFISAMINLLLPQRTCFGLSEKYDFRNF